MVTRCWEVGDGGNVGSILSPHMVGFMKFGKLWKKKKRVGLLLIWIPVLCLVVTLVLTTADVSLTSGTWRNWRSCGKCNSLCICPIHLRFFASPSSPPRVKKTSYRSSIPLHLSIWLMTNSAGTYLHVARYMTCSWQMQMVKELILLSRAEKDDL